MSGPQTNRSPDHGRPNQAECDAILEQAEAFVLGALDRFDAGFVEQHLRWCPRCRDEVEAITRVVNLLPLAVPVVDAPSSAVKSRLLARVANDNRTDPYEPERLQRPDELYASGTPSATPRPTTSGEDSGTAAMPDRSWLRFVPTAIIAPLAIVLIVVGAWANSMRIDLEDQQQELGTANQEELNRIVANGGDVRLYSMQPLCTDCTGRGRLGVDVADSVGVVVAWGLNPEQEHEVWCVNKKGDKQMVSRLDVDADGGAMQAFSFPDTMTDYSGVYIAQTDGEATYMTNLDADEPSATPER